MKKQNLKKLSIESSRHSDFWHVGNWDADEMLWIDYRKISIQRFWTKFQIHLFSVFATQKILIHSLLFLFLFSHLLLFISLISITENWHWLTARVGSYESSSHDRNLLMVSCGMDRPRTDQFSVNFFADNIDANRDRWKSFNNKFPFPCII
jgi:hypothetical protein